MEKKKIAVIRIRGEHSIKQQVIDTFKLLRLYKKNYCVVIENTPYYMGMLTRINDYATWGEISEETFKQLLETRGRLAGNERLTKEYLQKKLKLDFDSFTKEFFGFKKQLKDIPGLKLFFRLSPPRKGFERKGIKVHFSLGGVLGYRKENINDLIKRMV